MVSTIAGLAGGLTATVVTTVVMALAGNGGPPPTANLLAKFGGGDPKDHAGAGMILHLAYGIVAGGVFAVALPFAVADPSVGVAAVLGLAYGLVLGAVVGAGVLA